jgi:methylenetetrahydrofolate dehydrogenase (NADP+)/methenyltetrahydrofolate cyclohydrolase
MKGQGMAATIIDGKAFAADVRGRIAEQVAALKAQHWDRARACRRAGGRGSGERGLRAHKHTATVEVGMASFEHKLPADTSEDDLFALIDRLNADPAVHGILCQFPVPEHLDERRTVARIAPEKDVDGLSVTNAGLLATGGKALVSCTPLGCLMLLRDRHASLSGMEAVVIGRSNLFGKPMAQLLLQENCTVTIAHSRTKDLAGGVPPRRYPRRRRRAGRDGAGRLGQAGRDGDRCRDHARAASREAGQDAPHRGRAFRQRQAEVAGAITPVPGGVGPMTIACLLANTLTACCRANGLPEPEGLTV